MSLNRDRTHKIENPEELSRSRYKFPTPPASATSELGPAAPTASTAPPHRPRGRALIAFLMFGACAFGIFTVWDSFARYGAYGVVVGRTIEVSSAIDGKVCHTDFLDGDVVEQNSALATVKNLEIENKILQVQDELKIAEAKLVAETARIRWQAHVQETETTRAIAEFFETRSRLEDVNGQLNVLRDQIQADKFLNQHSSVPKRQLRQRELEKAAQESRIVEIKNEMNVLQTRAQKAQDAPRLDKEQTLPLQMTCEKLRQELVRLEAIREQGQIKSPVDGRILWSQRFEGERVDRHEPMYRILQESTLEIEMFVPQSMTLQYQVGDVVQLKIEPFSERVNCRVTAIGTEHREPPEQIERFYNKSTKLLPIRVIPERKFRNVNRLPVGAVAKLPQFAIGQLF